jgi:tRNA nucleotidyltransferase (CCA-adding enzyme)
VSDLGPLVLERAGAARALIDAATAAGVSLDGAWLVGGAVRDALLARPSTRDLDIAVEGDAHTLASLLAAGLGSDVEARSAFGTATVHVDLGEEHGIVQIDLASCRTERYEEPGALPTVELGASIEDDLPRRDVTVNAIAVSLDGSARLVAAPRAIDDLQARQLRVLHDRSFVDDPTRIVRVARYAGRLGFAVAEETRALAIDAVAGGALATLSADRLSTELRLVLREPAWEALTLLASWGVVERLDPRLEGAFHPPLLLRSIDAACGDDVELNERAWTLRLAALARPLGEEAGGWMGWLGFPANVVSIAVDHIRVLEAVIARRDELRAMPNSALYLELGEVVDDSIALAALMVGDDDQALLRRLMEFSEALQTTRLTVRGDADVAAGVPRGPLVGRILGVLFLRALDGELPDEAAERAALAELVVEATAGIQPDETGD